MNRETYEKVYFQENYARQFSALCGDQDTSRTAAAPAVDQAPMPNATTVVMMEDTPDGGVTITTGDFVAFFNEKFGYDRVGAMRRSIVQAQRDTELKRARTHGKSKAPAKKARNMPRIERSRRDFRPQLSFMRVVFGLMLVLSITMLVGTSFLLEATRTQVMGLESEVAKLENQADEIVSGEPVAENEQAELPSLSGENSVEVYLPTEEEKDSPVAALLNALAALGK